MKVLSDELYDGISDQTVEILAAIMNRMEVTTHDYEYLLPRGWRLIAELDYFDQKTAKLDIQADKGGGSFAEVKMKTLKDSSSKRPATGTDDISFIEELIVMEGLRETEVGAEICELMDAKHLTRLHHEWLRDKLGYTNFYGAIRIPFRAITIYPNMVDKNEIRFAFSGGTEEQDIMFAVWALSEFQRKVVESFREFHFTFDLDALKKIPNVQLWIDLLDVRESLCP